jgi:hypothetical protein
MTGKAPNAMSYGYPPMNGLSNIVDEDYDNEPPLLEELGIRFDHIWAKTQVTFPFGDFFTFIAR